MAIPRLIRTLHRMRYSLVVAATVALTACQDAPTTSAPRFTVHAQRLGQAAYVCSLVRQARVEGGWQTRIDTLYFPRPEVDPAGRVVRYTVRPAADVPGAWMAICQVPYTEAALRRVDHYFEVRSDGGAEQFRVRQNQATTQDCVLAGACLIDGIIAIGYRTGGGSGGGGGGNTGPGVGGCNNMAAGGPGTGTITVDAARDYTTMDCPGGGGDGNEGGYTYVPMSGYDMVPDTAGVPDCSQPQPLYADPTQNWGHAYCRSSAPAGVELDRTLDLLNNLEARGGVCAEIASFGRALLNNGRLRYYSFIPEYAGVGGWGSPALGALLDVSWITNFSPNDPNAIAKTLHEIEHAMGQGHVIGPFGYNQTPNEQSCAYGGSPSW